MRRGLSEFISIKAFKRLVLAPAIVRRIKNWFPFLWNYVGFGNGGEIYEFRNGTRIKASDGADCGTIVEVLVKRVYGAVLRNSVVIDIGAHIGCFSISVASNKNVAVYAYEPAKDNFNLLLENIRLNSMQKVIKPFNIGVGARAEKRKLYLRGASSHSLYTNERCQGSIDVACVSLKDILSEHELYVCDFLKIDAEGAEYEILLSTPPRYLRRIKRIALEYHQGPEELERFLRECGFYTVCLGSSGLSGILYARNRSKFRRSFNERRS